jgi:hypothetical protein
MKKLKDLCESRAGLDRPGNRDTIDSIISHYETMSETDQLSPHAKDYTSAEIPLDHLLLVQMAGSSVIVHTIDRTPSQLLRDVTSDTRPAHARELSEERYQEKVHKVSQALGSLDQLEQKMDDILPPHLSPSQLASPLGSTLGRPVVGDFEFDPPDSGDGSITSDTIRADTVEVDETIVDFAEDGGYIDVRIENFIERLDMDPFAEGLLTAALCSMMGLVFVAGAVPS